MFCFNVKGVLEAKPTFSKFSHEMAGADPGFSDYGADPGVVLTFTKKNKNAFK